MTKVFATVLGLAGFVMLLWLFREEDEAIETKDKYLHAQDDICVLSPTERADRIQAVSRMLIASAKRITPVDGGYCVP